MSSNRSPIDVLEHEVDVQALVRHVAGPQVDVEVAVVVDVPEVRAHRRHRPVEADLLGDVAEAVLNRGCGRGEGGSTPAIFKPIALAEHLGDPGPVVVDVEVEEAVVVVVPEPAGEAEVGAGDAELRGDVAELAVPFVVVQAARLAHVRDEEVEPAVAVVVAPGRALGATLVGDARRRGDVHERAVAAVVIEPATIAGVAGLRTTGRRREGDTHHRRTRRPVRRCRSRPRRPTRLRSAPPGRLATVTSSKPPSPLLRKQREPERRFPGPAQQQDIEIAVVVEVGPGDVQGVDLVAETGRGRPILERAVAPVDVQRGTQVGIERGGEEVGQTVAIEVVEDAAACQVRPPDAQAGRATRRSSNRPTSASERNNSTGIRYCGGTFSGYSPKVM